MTGPTATTLVALREGGAHLTKRELAPFPSEEGELKWYRRIENDRQEREAARVVHSGRTRAQRFWRALMLSPTLEVCEALMRGESVPLECLDQEWVERFGLRKAAA
jgi:hypothetical protein